MTTSQVFVNKDSSNPIETAFFMVGDVQEVVSKSKELANVGSKSKDDDKKKVKTKRAKEYKELVDKSLQVATKMHAKKTKKNTKGIDFAKKLIEKYNNIAANTKNEREKKRVVPVIKYLQV